MDPSITAAAVYLGSDGELTKRYYHLLCLSGPIGEIAMNLFRAQKCSARAKVYRGGIRGKGSFRRMAYERKAWSLEQLCKALEAHPQAALTFGWKKDPNIEIDASWVLYVDLPQGQVSFHSFQRYGGPDYAGDWDKQKVSAERILAFCDQVVLSRLKCEGNDERRSEALSAF